ncbi:unnamed protein product [Cryptosporidium hominis]|uniref:Uncharacterized protein n=1 Tax=Cryptosporidium hominis TaxID=237895 RepID=A0A0S4TE33_CRYHO|nr:hypothetical protein ChTU502y2012_295g0050 [Cryptosporidium hominis]PPA64361.1 hypothetical protein ChUKH1_04305 [Cryptosporidium hominis]PPS92650.1 Uncharacterized protein GY17_00003343 [Cryptosporidium hominis]CUV05545.1 unnamed protein product [Cryptosporidium hominis]|eukprot:PPS92650.1 Uncharacterized protein GY17_00003343 [Cryptosporidium hominis]
MNILINDNIHEIRNIYEPENENEFINKNYSIIGINKRRKTACEREAIFNRLILNNPSIISVDKTLLPGTCVYCNICQVRIILNPAYYLNNWRTHMNGKLHKALSKAVGSPQFLDEIDFCLEKEEDSYFDSVNVLGYDNNNIDNFTETNCGVNTINNIQYINNDDNNQNDNINITNCMENYDLMIKNPRILSYISDSAKNNNEIIIDRIGNNTTQYGTNQYDNKVMEILEEENDNKSNLESLNIRDMNDEDISRSNIDTVGGELEIKNHIQQNNIQIEKQEYVIHPLISNLGMEKNQIAQEFSFILGDELYNTGLYSHNSEIVDNNTNTNNNSNSKILYDDETFHDKGKLLNSNYLQVYQNDTSKNSNITYSESDLNLDKNKTTNNVVKYFNTNIINNFDNLNKVEKSQDNLIEEINESKFQNNLAVSENNCQLNNNYLSLGIPVISPIIRTNFEQIGTFYCPGINKVRYWAMCFIGSERSTEPEFDLNNYSDTRRVFYKQSIITKVSPNHEPEHQGVVHHPNCLEIVPKPNEPCERCSLYINNRQLARVISKRATRLQEMWDRVVAGESIINGGKIPQSIISAYNHRIDHWSRCNDPLEAITRALAGCRQRDYTNFFWKIRENLLKNSRLIRNQL